MGIENFESGPVTSQEFEKDEIAKNELPTSITEVVEKFADPVEINNAEKIVPFFRTNFNKNRLCIAIPVTTEDETVRKEELGQIGKNLRTAIFEYTGLDRESDIGISLKGLIGEATSDVAKHTVLRDRFDRILALVTKANLEISFHLVNPARPDVDLNTITHEDSIEEYDAIAHGQNVAKGLEEDLLKNGCQSITDESHLVQDSNRETVAVERDISVELPR